MGRVRTTAARITLAVATLASMLVLVGSPPPASADTCTGGPQPFIDVPLSHPFCEEIVNVSAANLVAGYPTAGGLEFRPSFRITRQAAAAMLTNWDRAGEPGPGCAEAPFTDVPVTHQFCYEIFWVSDSEPPIMGGFADGEFKPTLDLSRQAVAAILARKYYRDDPIPPCTSAPFVDVPVSNPFCAEIQAAADLGIVTGYAGGMFQPGASITRQAFAAMLWRAYELIET